MRKKKFMNFNSAISDGHITKSGLLIWSRDCHVIICWNLIGYRPNDCSLLLTEKELFRFGIKMDDGCLYCGDKDSIEYSLIECAFTQLFNQIFLDWFNQVNECQIYPTIDETLFGITASSLDTTIIRKFNYIALFRRYYIYASKLNSLAISIQDFVGKLLIKYDLKNCSLIGR